MSEEHSREASAQEGEAGAQAQAHDPSMEDILSSIRRVLSEDSEKGAGEDAAAEPEPEPVLDEVFDLTSDMIAQAAPQARTIVSDSVAHSATDALSELARVILDRRDIAVGTHGLTLESIVREMLRPLLREWLDRNLPYLIERLVKKELDLMINRAERLED